MPRSRRLNCSRNGRKSAVETADMADGEAETMPVAIIKRLRLACNEAAAYAAIRRAGAAGGVRMVFMAGRSTGCGPRRIRTIAKPKKIVAASGVSQIGGTDGAMSRPTE